ncbi:ABC transporter [Devosia riboflavina]|uniref:ABC transporter n=1 Tax=Devosia riboflavina TaxID=46914 RepID=A0A087M582_9HYPH|nr:ABC transporter ATP-binding protein [Devosia riboflavina]KFL32035.1 ABC transporter [Devosia riboflavina]
MSLLTLSNVTKRFGGLTAVNDLSFTLTAGETVGLLGPNGSGKTTALNMISGYLPVTSGSIALDGTTISTLGPERIAHRGVARTFQLVRALPSLTVGENVLAALAFRKDPLWGSKAEAKIENLLADVGLAGRQQEQASNLTYIDLKRMELARALATEPKLLLLDEWLAGLNPTELRAGIDLITRLRQSGITILLVEHVMDAVRALCTRCIVMNTGSRLADGPTADVLADKSVIRAYLGDDHA